MGTKNGLKILSYNTTVRNPERFKDILKAISKFDGNDYDNNTKKEIMIELYRSKIVIPSTINPEYVESFILEEDLSRDDAIKIMDYQEKKIPWEGRAPNYVTTLIWFGLIVIDNNKLKITKIGHEYIKSDNEVPIYTRILINMPFGSSLRTNATNKNWPFRNFAYLLNELGNLSQDEFQYFFLTMTENNPEKIKSVILDYRKLSKDEKEVFREDYINALDFDSVSNIKKNVEKDYYDEVKRKLFFTGLFEENFVRNIRVKDGYETIFDELIEYMSLNKVYLDQFDDGFVDWFSKLPKLPWEDRDFNVIDAAKLGIDVDGKTSEELGLEISKLKNPKLMNNIAINSEIASIVKAIRDILSTGKTNTFRKKLLEVKPSVSIEWLTSLLLIRTTDYFVFPNLKIDDEGYPKSHAPGRMADIIIEDDTSLNTVEVTLIKNKGQMLNYETSNLVRHTIEIDSSKEKGLIFIAPYLHEDVLRFMKYLNDSETSPMVNGITPLTFEAILKAVEKEINLKDFFEKLNLTFTKTDVFKINEYIKFLNK